ncbi:NADH oxidase [Jeotgalibacillus soli]|uniref:NADH oxidase n=1 Tax=Jeotgalibacillus soli TaxID=889306 RepID=A0A0C2RUB1_9BACL|nr:NADH oxidase [Jeotgalibacillus soli]
MTIAVVGCTHAGTAAVKNMAKLYPEATITEYEKSDNVFFLSCGIALYVGGVIDNFNGLFYSPPEEITAQGVKLNMNHGK